jgi:NDP-sugar pyrophosphorylase family protein
MTKEDLKVAILAGGVGTRFMGEEVKPKPMVEINGC